MATSSSPDPTVHCASMTRSPSGVCPLARARILTSAGSASATACLTALPAIWSPWSNTANRSMPRSPCSGRAIPDSMYEPLSITPARLSGASTHPQTGWTKVQLTKLQLKAMYAAGHIFWETDVARLLVLDTSTMESSEHGVPWEIVSTSWAIGELRDGKGCLVCLQGLNSSFGKDGLIVEEPLRLEVWALKKEEEDKQGKFCCKCEKGVRVSEMLPEDARSCV
ncbi:hypothetical protein VPH35_000575 [Triticum aestivum]